MLYQFPPPEWFESGTTSLVVLTICLWAIIICIPASVLGCWIFRPRSRIVWILAETFWIVTSTPLLLCWVPFPTFFWLSSRDAPVYLVLAATCVLILVPFSAAVAGINEIVRGSETSSGFRDRITWGFTLPICLFALFWLMMPSLIHHPEATRRPICKDNLKQIGLAMHNYHDQFAKLPDAQSSDGKSPPVSWRVAILPHIDHKKPNSEYDLAASWDSDENSLMAKSDVGLYVCPSVPIADRKDAASRWYTAYATLVGSDTAFSEGKGKTFRDFSDGTSNTALVAEACGQQIVWTEPRDIELTEKNLGINLPGHKSGQSVGSWSSYHRSGAHLLLADGSVRFLSAATDPTVLHALTTTNGGETVHDF